jgi:hypothetical protein
MKAMLSHTLLINASFCLSTVLPIAALEPGNGPGGHGGGPGRGGGMGDFQEAIHTLFANHAKIKRKKGSGNKNQNTYGHLDSRIPAAACLSCLHLAKSE